MTYRGDIATISSNTTTDINAVALAICSFIMQKIINILSILSFLLISSSLVGTFIGYRWLTSPKFEKYLKNKIMNNIDNVLPDAIKGGMPEFTTPPIAKPKLSVPL